MILTLILLVVVHGLIFTVAMCWAAKVGDETMDAYFKNLAAPRVEPPPAPPVPPARKTRIGSLIAWANAPLRRNTRRHSLGRWLVFHDQLT